jgi:diaminohydroxyphosphoribosylaminopyrimidine deaminase/5-amino-6-(5-phosphoribosylamino)uracil reductase
MAKPSRFMAEALREALQVRGTTSPNPWVGAVVVRDGQVLSKGATAPAPGPHAETAALSGIQTAGADLYVTLEPCVAFGGKRTRPCSERIIAAGIRRVFVALIDPDPRVRGSGVAALRNAGIEVHLGDGAEAALDALRPYVRHRQSGRPYVIAKFAGSLDGRTATASGESRWITGEAARERAHEQRAWVDAVLVGSGTVLADDPALTARPGGREALRQPLRVVADGRGRTRPDAALFTAPGPVLIITSARSPASWRSELAAKAATVIECEPSLGGVNLDQLLLALGQRGVMSLWAEGGGTLLGSLFAGGHVDEVWAFIAPLVLGGDALPSIAGEGARSLLEVPRLHSVEVERLGDDVLIRGYLRRLEPQVE